VIPSSPTRQFASDNNAGIHPEVLRAIEEANRGHVPAYGDDPHTRGAVEGLRRHFGPSAEVFLVFSGTGANVAALAAMAEPHQSILCSASAHIYVDECGAPERFTGCKLQPIPTADGKLRPADIISRLSGIGVEHHVQPRVVSVTQASELGTVYTPDELRALSQCCRANGLLLHMDGARLANAAASLGTSLAALTAEVGVDAVCLGGTKNGLLGAEAVIFLNGHPAERFKYIRKQATQLASKMRFLGAQFTALMAGELWRRNAEHANAMARRLAERVGSIPGVRLTQPVEANGVFATMARPAINRLLQRYFFYVWNDAADEVRWMTAWDTTEDDVDRFAEAVRQCLA
jgi:threonine aldolase